MKKDGGVAMLEVLDVGNNPVIGEVIGATSEFVVYYAEQSEQMKLHNMTEVVAVNINTKEGKHIFTCRERMKCVEVLEETVFMMNVENGVTNIIAVQYKGEFVYDIIGVKDTCIGMKVLKNPFKIDRRLSHTVLVVKKYNGFKTDTLDALGFIGGACCFSMCASESRIASSKHDENTSESIKIVTGKPVEKGRLVSIPIAFAGAVFELAVTKEDMEVYLFMDVADNINFSEYEAVEIVEYSETERIVKLIDKDGLESTVGSTVDVS